jgi:hypothetical protein
MGFWRGRSFWDMDEGRFVLVGIFGLNLVFWDKFSFKNMICLYGL